nr:hypothetical protein [Pantoea sp. 201603H]
MGSKDLGFDIVYRGRSLEKFSDGKLVFFQRSEECGGGYWFVRTYGNSVYLELEHPASLRQGIQHIMELGDVYRLQQFNDDQFGLPFDGTDFGQLWKGSCKYLSIAFRMLGCVSEDKFSNLFIYNDIFMIRNAKVVGSTPVMAPSDLF